MQLGPHSPHHIKLVKMKVCLFTCPLHMSTTRLTLTALQLCRPRRWACCVHRVAPSTPSSLGEPPMRKWYSESKKQERFSPHGSGIVDAMGGQGLMGSWRQACWTMWGSWSHICLWLRMLWACLRQAQTKEQGNASCYALKSPFPAVNVVGMPTTRWERSWLWRWDPAWSAVSKHPAHDAAQLLEGQLDLP